MKARSKLSLVLLCGILACCVSSGQGSETFKVEFEPDKSVGLISGYATEQRFRGFPACPEEHICIDAVFEIRIEDAQLLAGSIGAPISRVWAVQHGEAPGNPPQFVFIAQTAKDGRVWAHDGSLVRDGRACFSEWAWQNYRGLLEDAGAVLTGDEVCLPVSSLSGKRS